MTDAKPLHYRPDIDGLRALAVILVMAYHAFPKWVPGGFVGVDVFFVISGYLISGIILRDVANSRFSFLEFYARRCRRIVPALVLVLLATWILGWNDLLAEDFKNLGKHILAGASFNSNYILWRESGYFDSAAELKPLLHLWSLGVEEQFYLLWPALLVFSLRWRLKVGWLIGGLLLLSFLDNVFFVRSAPALTFYMLPGRFWELMLGSGLAYYERLTPLGSMSPSPDLRKALTYRLAVSGGLVGLVLVLAGAWAIGKNAAFPGWWALLPTTGTVLILAGGLRFLAARPAVFLGKISYPLYLWHWPLLSLLQLHRGAAASAYERVGVLALAVLLAWLTWTLIEKPAQKKLTPGRSRNFVYASLVAMALLAVVGSLTQKQTILSSVHKQKLALLGNKSADEVMSTWQVNSCFLLNQTAESDQFASECFKPVPGKQTILIWGDSFAAHLYPGLKDYFAPQIQVLQLSTADCAPVLAPTAARRLNCAAINDYVFALIGKIKPAVLILSANWKDNLDRDGSFLDKLTLTLNKLKSAGPLQIAVIGQAPIWEMPLPDVLERNFIRRGLPIPQATTAGLLNEVFQVDREVRARVEQAGHVYIPLLATLCPANVCMTSVGEDLHEDLISFDFGHFSQPGSRFVVTAAIGPPVKKIMPKTTTPP